MKRFRAVSFDAGGTLIEPWPSVGAVYARVAREKGVVCDPDALNTQFAVAWRSRASFGYTRMEWFDMVRQTFGPACAISADLFDAIYDRFAEREAWLIYDDVIPTLQRLEQLGLPLVVISNWDERLVPLLERIGLASYFDEIIVSATVGVHKPDTRIFMHAARVIDLDPGEILHIGDSHSEDVEGARSAGFQALHLKRAGAKGTHEVENLTSLLSWTRSDTQLGGLDFQYPASAA